jgi:hypothetical protein
MRRFDPAMPCPALRFSGVRVRELIVDTKPLTHHLRHDRKQWKKQHRRQARTSQTAIRNI